MAKPGMARLPAPIKKAAVSAPQVSTLLLGDGREARLRVVINPRARQISLRLDPTTREVVAVAPNKRACARAKTFAAERATWIAAVLDRLPKAQAFLHGAEIPVRGRPCLLRHEPGRGASRLEAGPPPALIAGGLDGADFARRVRRFLLAQARADLTARVEAHAAALGARFTRIAIKDTRSRWGSCTRAGALAFSWRVILAPPPVLDYLAAHEVAHLKEMNHGPRFWALVAQLCPAHLEARAWLKRHGPALHAIGAEG